MTIRLRYEREKRKLTRQALGAKASVGPARVGGLELGRIVPCKDSVELRRLADALAWEGDPAALLDPVCPVEDAARHLLEGEGHAGH
jgi:transcriptional regulator with XRE-family HTH domain